MLNEICSKLKSNFQLKMLLQFRPKVLASLSGNRDDWMTDLQFNQSDAWCIRREKSFVSELLRISVCWSWR